MVSSKDTKTKQYTKDPRIFADAFNQYVYHGREVVRARDLQEMDAAETVYIAGDGKRAFSRQKQRDVKKRWIFKKDEKNVYALLAIENQSDIHYAMPLKVALYDVMQLEEQRRVIEAEHRRVLKEKRSVGGDAEETFPEDCDTAKSSRTDDETVSDGVFAMSGAEFISGFGKNDRLVPIITLVIYYGADEWDAPKRLREMYAECDEEMLRYVIDYQINLIAPYHMSDEELEQFHTSLRQVLTYIKYSKDKEQLRRCMEVDTNFRDLDREAAEVIREMTNARFSVEEGKERVDMCLAEEQMIQEGREQGRAEGRDEGRAEGREEGREEGIARSLVACVENVIKNVQLTLEAACEAVGTTVSKYEESKALLNGRNV